MAPFSSIPVLSVLELTPAPFSHHCHPGTRQDVPAWMKRRQTRNSVRERTEERHLITISLSLLETVLLQKCLTSFGIYYYSSVSAHMLSILLSSLKTVLCRDKKSHVLQVRCDYFLFRQKSKVYLLKRGKTAVC